MNKERINQINQRLAQIDSELRNAKDIETIEALTKESSQLIEERGRLIGQAASEARQAFQNVSGVDIEVPGQDSVSLEEKNLRSMTRRNKLAFLIGKQARRTKLTDIETRALKDAITSTATTYAAPTASTEGSNNAGIFISTKLVLDFLKEDGKLSPLFNDVSFTNIKGLIDFPYRESRDKAQAKEEGKGTSAASWKWGKLTGTKGTLQSKMIVTDEIMALTDIELGEYIVEQMLNDLPEDWSEDLIYGTGTANHIKGITNGLIAKEYTDAMTGLVDAIKACKGKFRRGAKVYCAQDVYDDVFFAVDKNGNFKYPVLNNPNGVNSIGTIHIAVDENLKEGDFVVGNVSKYFKANLLRGLSVESDRNIDDGYTLYVAKEMCSVATYPNAFIYSKKKVATQE